MEPSPHLCPYIERRDARCAGAWTLTNLRDAMGQCAGEHRYCSIYHRIRRSDVLGDYMMEMPVARLHEPETQLV